mmetsp:Transcript_55465/g.134667  ORF Transcript_55465/g.134667 Transcript_55465/m.134667 type:complete len:91 (+) Transcript_55465:250-522(+)
MKQANNQSNNFFFGYLLHGSEIVEDPRRLAGRGNNDNDTVVTVIIKHQNSTSMWIPKRCNLFHSIPFVTNTDDYRLSVVVVVVAAAATSN